MSSYAPRVRRRSSPRRLGPQTSLHSTRHHHTRLLTSMASTAAAACRSASATPIPQHANLHLRVHGATTARLAHEVRRRVRRRHGNPLRSLGPQTRVRPTLYSNTQTPTAVPRSGASPPSSCPPRQTASRVPPAAPVSSASPTSPPSPPHTSSAA